MPDKHRHSIHRSDELVERIRPLLSGESPEVIGATLGELVAIWLVGHRADDQDQLREFRATIFEAHVALIRDLVELYDQRFAAGDWPPGSKH